VPWTDYNDTGPEAVCLTADMCVSPPVAPSNKQSWLPHPNPDLSLRFSNNIASQEVIGVGKSEAMDAGLANVSIKVFQVLN
jgi:hypothetical protein